MRVEELLKKETATLRAAGIPSPRVDAEVLLGFVLGCDRLVLYWEPRREVAAGKATRFKELVARRAAGEPVAYLTGEKEFMGLSFSVTPAVLIPRPETELLVETAVTLLQGAAAPVVADVGTGSGAVAVSLAVLLPAARVFAVDISTAALAVARENACRHRVADRVVFYAGDLLEPFAGNEAVFDLIAANLPYIPSGEMGALPPEVRREPVLALDGGPDGLNFYRRLVPQAERLLKPGGHLLLEIGPGQGAAVSGLLPPPVWEGSVKPDLAGRDRLVVAQYRG
uniref:Release factor glutamine methyltransferase n=1 Tax=Ammonifex degensii TaxID=42838 RepID=A0A7C2HUN4_9THEO